MIRPATTSSVSSTVLQVIVLAKPNDVAAGVVNRDGRPYLSYLHSGYINQLY